MFRVLVVFISLMSGLAMAQAAREDASLPALAQAIRSQQGTGDQLKGAEIARRIEALRRDALAAGDDQRLRKLALLESLQAATLQGPHPLEATEIGLQLQVPAAASRCEAAVPMREDQTVALQRQGSAALATTWLSFTAPRAGKYRVSTLGSGGDPRLELWASCAQRAGEWLASNDDSVDLSAVLPLRAERAGQTFLLRLDNEFPTAQQRVSITEGGGYDISGRVTANGISVEGVGVVASTLSGQYMGYAYTNASDGSYNLFVYDAVDVVLRTVAPNQGTPYMMVAHPDSPCYTPEANSIIGHCGNPASLTQFQAAQAPHVDVNFNLTLGAAIGGTVLAEGASQPGQAKVTLRESTQSAVVTVYTNQVNRYQQRGLPPGEYLIEAGTYNHVREIYDNVPCVGDVCNPALGTLVPVTAGAVAVANFDLADLRRLQVQVSGLEPYTSVSLAVLDEYGNPQNYQGRSPDEAGVAHFRIDQPAGPFRLYLSGYAQISQVYPAVLCTVENCQGQLLSGELLQMPADGPLSLSMQAHIRPSIRGLISDANGLPLEDVSVLAFPVGATYASRSDETGADGRYSIDYLYPGSYLVRAYSDDHVDELYPDVPCQPYGSTTTQCSGATVLNLGANGLQGIDLALVRSARIEGRVEDDAGDPGSQLSVAVAIIDANGGVLAATSVASDGSYELADLLPGSVRVGAYTNGFYSHIFPTIHDGIYCARPVDPYQPFAGCAGGTVFQLTSGDVRNDIDLLAIGATSRSVLVSRSDTGQPIEAAVIDYWDVDGNWRGAALTNAEGFARVSDYYSAGSVPMLLSTSNSFGLIDEVYDDIACPDGAAFYGLCSLAGAMPVDSWNPSPTSPPIRIELSPDGSEFIWAHGFED